MDLVDRLLSGALDTAIVTHDKSQYSGTGGVSACGLAALNCARIVLGRERDGIRGASLLREIIKQQTSEEVLQLCSSWTSSAHLDVEDIYAAPAFRRSLKLVTSDFGETGLTHFRSLAERLRAASLRHGCSSCAVITRPPEIICCFYIALPESEMFIVFDSHPRPELHPEGAAFIFHTTSEGMAQYLDRLLPYDRSLLADKNVQWEAQLLGNFSGHVFVAKNQPASIEHWTNADMQASLQILHLRAEWLELKSQNSNLTRDNSHLQEEVERYKRELAAERRRTKAPSPVQKAASPSRNEGILATIVHHGSNALSAAWSVGAVPQEEPGWNQVSRRSRALPTPDRTSQHASTSRNDPSRLDPTKQSDRGRSATKRTDSIDVDTSRDLELALQQQLMFDEENFHLLMERDTLVSQAPEVFECGVCFERHSEESVAKVDKCGHRYCRDCVRRYVSSQLGERRFPIFCPLCVADKKSQEPAVLGNSFVQQIGLSEEEFAIWVELEMAAFSILLNCRSCKQSFFADKQEYEATNIIACPLPQCQNSWCRSCNHSIDQNGPPHSCDGTAELRHLMGQRGWKYCPGCQTPAEKVDGCNHMTCTSPGCNMHFCYLCGKAIVRSVKRQEIKDALCRHYRSCRMFEDIPDLAVPP